MPVNLLKDEVKGKIDKAKGGLRSSAAQGLNNMGAKARKGIGSAAKAPFKALGKLGKK
jgi:hypothetical protein